MNKYLKYTVRGIAFAVGAFLLLYVVAYIYVSINRKEIIAQVTEQISGKLEGKVTIGDVDLSFVRTFPQISVLMEKVSIKDTLYDEHKHPFFTADRLYARISVINVITKDDPLTGIRIDDGNLYIYTDTAGYSNNYLLSGKKKQDTAKTSGPKKLQLNEIKLQNFHITLDNQRVNKLLEFDAEKFVCDITENDSTYKLHTKNNIYIKSLAFNLKKGSYVKGKTFKGNFDLFYDLRKKQLRFDHIAVNIGDHPFDLSGRFNMGNNSNFKLRVNTKKLDVAKGRTYLPEKVALAVSVVTLDKPINIKVAVDGPLTPGEPLVNVDWSTTASTTITTPFFVFNNCTFTGGYTNELIKGLPRKDPNSRIRVHQFTGDWEGIPLKSKNIYIDDLVHPMINFDVVSSFPLTTLNNVLQNNSIKLNEGNANLDITYSGPLMKNNNANTLVNGFLKISNGLVLYAPRNIPLKNVNGAIVFKNTDILVKDIRTNVMSNSIIMNGSLKNVFALIETNPGKIALDWHIYSPELNLAGLNALLKKRASVANVNTGKSKFGKTARQIDEMLEQSNVALELKADKLIFKKFTATNVNASITMVENSWNLDNVSLRNGGGTMKIKGYIRDKNDRISEIKAKVNINNADVNDVMYSFSDFGQDGISFKNLKGKLNSDVDIKLDIDNDLAGMPENMEGLIKFSLKNGALIDYEPIKKLQIFLFKNRNFDEIKFAELKNTLELKNKEVKINRMEIQSTALTLFVEGIFSMKGNTDLSIQVPLNNLKKRDEDYKPENIGVKAKAGASIYVRGRPGEDGNIKFKLDLFKKFRKEDNGEKEEDDKKNKSD